MDGCPPLVSVEELSGFAERCGQVFYVFYGGRPAAPPLEEREADGRVTLLEYRPRGGEDGETKEEGRGEGGRPDRLSLQSLKKGEEAL
jgi:hypothetical protein